MAQLSPADRDRLTQAVREHEYLRRLVREIEKLHRLVFHRHDLDVTFIRASAEEILVADIHMRHRGNFDGVYFELRAAEDAGRKWDRALSDYAAKLHAYYTTPLGILIRRDLFGESAHFVSALAQDLAKAVESPTGAAR